MTTRPNNLEQQDRMSAVASAAITQPAEITINASFEHVQESGLLDATIKMLGILNVDQVKALTCLSLPSNALEPFTILSEIHSYFTETKKALLEFSDSPLVIKAEEIIQKARLNFYDVDCFAERYFSANDTQGASKDFLVGSIVELLTSISEQYKELEKILPDLQTKNLELKQPDLSVLTKPKKSHVLESSCSETESRKPSKELTLDTSRQARREVAKILTHTDDFDPHKHLLVDGLTVVNATGELENLELIKTSQLSKIGQTTGEVAIVLEFKSEDFSSFPNYSISKIKHEIDPITGRTAYHVTYVSDPYSDSYTAQDYIIQKANMCVPEHISELYEKLYASDLTIEEVTQLITATYFSGNLIYNRGPQIETLLYACPSKHRLSFALGLGVGDCQIFASVLQQLLAHADINAVIEVGAVCDAEGTSYRRPGHARVKVYGADDIIRIDPTIWTNKDLSFTPVPPAALRRFVDELATADAKKAYNIGLKVRQAGVFKDTNRDNPTSITMSRKAATRSTENNQEITGHQLGDDFDQSSKVSAYKMLASTEADVLVAQCWEIYNKACKAQENHEYAKAIKWAKYIVSEATVAMIEREVELVGLENSRLCSDIPKMLIKLDSAIGRLDSDTLYDFINSFKDKEIGSAILARFLCSNTARTCREIISTHAYEVAANEMSARFIIKLLKLENISTTASGILDDGFMIQIINNSEHFPATLQQHIFDELKQLLLKLQRKEAYLIFYINDLGKLSTQALSYLYPEYKSDPVNFLKKLLFELDQIEFCYFTNETPQAIACLPLIYYLCQYLDPNIRQQFKPIVADYLSKYLSKYNRPIYNTLRHPELAALAELCALDNDFILNKWNAHRLRNYDDYKEFMPFIIGNYLDQLDKLGVVDRAVVEPYLKNPSRSELSTLATRLKITQKLFTTDFINCQPTPINTKKAELYLAALAVFIASAIETPKKNLVNIAMNAALVSEAAIMLASVLYIDKVNLSSAERLSISINLPHAIRLLFDPQDNLRLSSYLNIHHIYLAIYDYLKIDPEDTNHLTDKAYERLASMLRKYPNYELMAANYKMNNVLEENRQSLQTLMAIATKACNSLKTKLPLPDNLTLTREFTKALIANKKLTKELPLLKLSTRSNNPNFWQQELIKSLRAQRAEGDQILLRKLTQQRNDSFESLRTYQAGDDIRTVDWKASARIARPVVKTYNMQQQTLADSYHVMLDMADLVTAPEFYNHDVFGYYFRGLEFDKDMLLATGNFIASLLQEGKKVTFSVFALGAKVHEISFTTNLKNQRATTTKVVDTLHTIQKLAYQYQFFCLGTQTIPDAYSIAGLMNQHESEHFEQEISNTKTSQLIIQLQGNNTAKHDLDPLLTQLLKQGKAARVNLKLRLS